MTTAKKRIMVIDDEPHLTRLLKVNLERTGHYEAEVANDPATALDAAEAFQPDLILLDVMMPGMDGGELAARLKANRRLAHVPAVFLTAAVKREEVRSRGGTIGGLPFLAKPVELHELIECIRSHLPG